MLNHELNKNYYWTTVIEVHLSDYFHCHVLNTDIKLDLSNMHEHPLSNFSKQREIYFPNSVIQPTFTVQGETVLPFQRSKFSTWVLKISALQGYIHLWFSVLFINITCVLWVNHFKFINFFYTFKILKHVTYYTYVILEKNVTKIIYL